MTAGSGSRGARRSASARREALEQLPDGELATACAEGNELAWDVLVRRYRRLVYAVPNRARLPEDQIEEVFHQTFAKLAERIGSIRDRDRVRSWMVTTARRLTIDFIRARQSSRRVDMEDEAIASIADESESAPESLVRLERQHLVRQAMLGIGERCRRLLTALFYRTGPDPPSYDGVSEELGIPIGSIGPTRARCLKKLKDGLERMEKE
ncbi:MAG TPA: sigma-70 family RNA polymerase sigma factor [bacterium]|nr:sigma-70 family RNA polymerase sigma factor [bacterium]